MRESVAARVDWIEDEVADTDLFPATEIVVKFDRLEDCVVKVDRFCREDVFGRLDEVDKVLAELDALRNDGAAYAEQGNSSRTARTPEKSIFRSKAIDRDFRYQRREEKEEQE